MLFINIIQQQLISYFKLLAYFFKEKSFVPKFLFVKIPCLHDVVRQGAIPA